MPDIETSNIKITLAAARKNAGFTQAEAAKKKGISRATISNWEKGKTVPNVEILEELCDLYNIPSKNIFLPFKSTKSR